MSATKAQPCRLLGRDGPKIPSVGLGLMGFSIAYGSIPPNANRLAFLDQAWSLGATNWDTADCYGDCEDIIGQWLRLHPERRQDIFLATKFGLKPDPTGEGAYGLIEDSSPEYCHQAVQKSLKRLGTSYIDLYYVHRVQAGVPIEKTMLALKDLQRQGLIKHIGLSEVAGTTIRRAHAVAPVAAVQVEYSPWSLEIESEEASKHVKQVCKELGTAIFCYSPLGKGLLTGKYRSVDDFEESDVRKNMSRFQEDNLAHNLAIADKFKEVAERKDCTPGQLVLAWLLSQGENVFVIPGTKRIEYLKDNLHAARVGINGEEERELRVLAQAHSVVGDRNNAWSSYVETVESE